MVVQGPSESPTEVSAIKASHMESTKYVIVKNHVRELTIETDDVNNEENTQKRLKKVKNRKRSVSDSHKSDTEINMHTNVSDISGSDIEELRSVYKECQAVMNKIETKYGHLLDLYETSSARKSKSKERGYVDECSCGLNKKIVFDDDGQQIEQETRLDCRVCQKKLKWTNSYGTSVRVQFEETVATLPDDVLSLSNILKNPDISVRYRNKVIDKMRKVKQDILSEVKFKKPLFKDMLKTKPEDIFEFVGANLFTLPGYT